MLSKVLSFILYYPQIVLPVCGVAIAYLSVYKKRPIKHVFTSADTSSGNLPSIFDR